MTGLAITLRHAVIAGALAGDHRDSFDRILSAQSLCDNLIFISNDEILDRFGTHESGDAMSDRLYPPRPIIAASVAVFRDGKVLLAARVNPPGAHVFSLPGGLVEIGETLEEAALRELMEEVYVEARIIGFVGHVEVIERDAEDRIRRHFVVNTFAAEWVSGEPQTSPEAAAVQWTDPASLGGLAVTKGLSGILEKAVRVMSAASIARESL